MSRILPIFGLFAMMLSPLASAGGKKPAASAEGMGAGQPIEDNRVFIYTDLGVYAGQRLGTPCDDLM
jgi:hypothetical protein